MRPPIGVIFDMDGVLVDSADAHRRAWQRLGDEVGVPFTADRFRQSFGQRNESIIPAWLGPVSPQRVAALGARKEVLYRQLARAGDVRVYPRVPHVFADLHRYGARVAIASSGPRENITLLVKVMRAGALIDVVVSAEDVQRGKPDPEGFLLAAHRIGAAANACAVVEDSVHGVAAACAAGMLAVAVHTSTDHDALRLAGADRVMASVGDLDVAELVTTLRQRGAGGRVCKRSD
jgi:beta-phosphoglucomutase